MSLLSPSPAMNPPPYLILLISPIVHLLAIGNASVGVARFAGFLVLVFFLALLWFIHFHSLLLNSGQLSWQKFYDRKRRAVRSFWISPMFEANNGQSRKIFNGMLFFG